VAGQVGLNQMLADGLGFGLLAPIRLENIADELL